MKLNDRNVNGSVLAIVAEGFLSRLSFGLISFALPLYALRLGMGLPEIGVLISLDSMAALALKPVTGWVADRIGLKRAFTAAVTLRSLIPLLLILAGAPWHLFAIRLLHGLSAALRDPSVHSLLAEHGGEKTVASAFAWYSTAKSVAGSLAKAAAGILLTLTVSNFSLVFGAACILSLLPLYAVGRYVRERGDGIPDARPVSKGEAETPALPDGRLWRLVLPFIGLGALLSGTANMLSGLFPVLATEYAGLSEAQTGMIYTLSMFVTFVSGPAFGWLSDHVSRRLVFLVRSGANTLSSLVYLVFPSFAGVALGRAVDDMGKAAFRPAWGALMAQLSSFDRRRRAQIIGYMNMGEDIGGMAAPVLAGWLWGAFGLPVMLGVRILLAVVTEVCALLIAHPVESARPPAKEFMLMNYLNRILVMIGLLLAGGWLALAGFAPLLIDAFSREVIAGLASNRLLAIVLLTVLGGLLALEVWPRRPRRVLAQDGQTALMVTTISQRVTARLRALEAVRAVEAEIIGRPKGAEVHLRLLVRERTIIPVLVEQINREVQDELEVQLGVRLLQTRCLIGQAPPDSERPHESRPARLSAVTRTGSLAPND